MKTAARAFIRDFVVRLQSHSRGISVAYYLARWPSIVRYHKRFFDFNVQIAFTTNFSVGFKYFLTDRVGVRFDARDVAGRYQAALTNVAGAPGVVVNGRLTLNDVQLNEAVYFRFGGR